MTRYWLDARGTDFMERGTGVFFPIYDAHGNMVATLSRNGSGYSVNDRRIYAAWGDIRGAGMTSDPKGRYCANLGHRQDDESGMVYMRARYYAPTTGRFISEDPARDGGNWYTYCGNDPENFSDRTGRYMVTNHDVYGLMNSAAILTLLLGFGVAKNQAARVATIALATFFFKQALNGTNVDFNQSWAKEWGGFLTDLSGLAEVVAGVAIGFGMLKDNPYTSSIALVTTAHMCMLIAGLASIDGFENGD